MNARHAAASPPTPEDEVLTHKQRIDEAYASAPGSIEGILELLPDLAAEVVRRDVAARTNQGVRSNEQDQVFGLVLALRERLRAAEASALRALMAGGCQAQDSIRWLRSSDQKEPLFQRTTAREDELVRVPIYGGPLPPDLFPGIDDERPFSPRGREAGRHEGSTPATQSQA